MVDCIRFLRVKLARDKGMTQGVLDYICSANWISGVTLCDDKHRFQLAGATDENGPLLGGSNITSFEYIRAKSGHSGPIASLVNDNSAYLRIDPNYANDFSCICHT